MKPRAARYPAIITAMPLIHGSTVYPATVASRSNIILPKWAMAIIEKNIALVVKYHLLFFMCIVYKTIEKLAGL